MLNLIINEWHPLLTGLWNTILCSLIALIGSLIIGTFFALLQCILLKLMGLLREQLA